MTIFAVQQSPLKNFTSRKHYFSSTCFPPLMSDSFIIDADNCNNCTQASCINRSHFCPHHIFTV